MLTRRHVRVKVMQSLYAFHKSENNNLKNEEKFLLKSMEEMYDLFLLQLNLFVEIKNYAKSYLEKSQQKHLATETDKNPNKKFIHNSIFQILEDNIQLQNEIEDRKLTHWNRDDEYVRILWEAIRESDSYQEYMDTESSSFKEDKDFAITIFKKVIAPNDKVYEYFEDKKLTWLDDLPLVNTAVVKMLQKLKKNTPQEAKLPSLFKSIDDKEFAFQLFQKTYLKDETLAEEMLGKTPNWDKDRIADIDTVLIKMAICEFLHFPSIPVKVTINEYLEISKEYSTPKSSIFINGILDKLSKEYNSEGKLNKIGRGLM